MVVANTISQQEIIDEKFNSCKGGECKQFINCSFININSRRSEK